MRHSYTVYFKPTTDHSIRDIEVLIASFPELRLETYAAVVKSEYEGAARRLFAEARKRGCRCSFDMRTTYEYEDALSGQLGILHLGPPDSPDFKARLPADAFELPPGCMRCGLGGRLTKRHVLNARALECQGRFYYGIDDTSLIPIMRSEIGERIRDATGVRGYMRHPITRTGKIVKEWMEPVPGATMPALSPRSEGIMWDQTSALADIGDPPNRVDPCPECGRRVWADSYERPRRLVYSQEAVELAEEHGIVWMREPKDVFPTFDPQRVVFKDFFGWPCVVFSRRALEAIVPYCQMGHITNSAYIEPMFSEPS